MAKRQHWDRLCEVANALQAELGLPAPAVSIDGASAYHLWLSLETPVPAGEAQDFLGAAAPGLLSGDSSSRPTPPPRRSTCRPA